MLLYSIMIKWSYQRLVFYDQIKFNKMGNITLVVKSGRVIVVLRLNVGDLMILLVFWFTK